jgi:hypothetical protein
LKPQAQNKLFLAPDMLRIPISKMNSEKDPTSRDPHPTLVVLKRQCPWANLSVASGKAFPEISKAENTPKASKAENTPKASKAENTPIPIKVMAATLNSKLTPDDGAAPCADDLAVTHFSKRSSTNKKRA